MSDIADMKADVNAHLWSKVYQSIDISVVFGCWVFFENLKGPHPLNFKKLFSAA